MDLEQRYGTFGLCCNPVNRICLRLKRYQGYKPVSACDWSRCSIRSVTATRRDAQVMKRTIISAFHLRSDPRSDIGYEIMSTNGWGYEIRLKMSAGLAWGAQGRSRRIANCHYMIASRGRRPDASVIVYSACPVEPRPCSAVLTMKRLPGRLERPDKGK